MTPTDRYTLTKLLGAGGMGEVYLAEDTLLKRQVAIKKVRPAAVGDLNLPERIGRECVLHAKVGTHPNIVSLYDRIDQGDEIMLVMEFVPGKPLRSHLESRTGGGMSVANSVGVTIQVLDALEVVHGLEIVHRDIKPENIMIVVKDDGTLVPKLLDFGIARGGGQMSITHTAQSSPGTPRYMAPEQIDPGAFGHVSPATDVYAIGIMLYELLTGAAPYSGGFHEILAGHLHRTVPPPKGIDGNEISKELTAIIQKATAKMPGDRFRSAREFNDALRRYRESSSDTISGLAAMGSRPKYDPGATMPAKIPTRYLTESTAHALKIKVKNTQQTMYIVIAVIVIVVGGGAVAISMKFRKGGDAKDGAVATPTPSAVATQAGVAATSTATPTPAPSPTPARTAAPNQLRTPTSGSRAATHAPTPAPTATYYTTPIPIVLPTPYPTPVPTPYATPTPYPSPTPYPTPTPAPSPTPNATATPDPEGRNLLGDPEVVKSLERVSREKDRVERLFKQKYLDISKSVSFAKATAALKEAQVAAPTGDKREVERLLNEAQVALTAAEKEAKSGW